MKRFWMSFGGVVTILVLFVAFNVLTGATLRSSRIDLTENKLYTLSEGTRNILGSLQEPITLRYYFSKKLAQKATGLIRCWMPPKKPKIHAHAVFFKAGIRRPLNA